MENIFEAAVGKTVASILFVYPDRVFSVNIKEIE